MGLFDTDNYINQNATVKEGTHISWTLKFNQSTPVTLFVSRNDGYGPNVYLMELNEYHNYKKGLVFQYLSQMSYENIESFQNGATLARGTYVLVAALPQIHDGGDSYSYFNIRFEEIK